MPVCYVANTVSVAHEAFDEETVLINLERGTYFSLRGSAPALWLLLQQPVSVEGLVGVLAQAVPGLPEDAGAMIGTMLAQLETEGCVLRLDVPEQLPTDLSPLALLGGRFSRPDVETFHDLQELIVIDPVHEVADFDGWPHRPPPFALD
jgi:Coenzyme PQQ synthesis protein D (PqqD)